MRWYEYGLIGLGVAGVAWGLSRLLGVQVPGLSAVELALPAWLRGSRALLLYQDANPDTGTFRSTAQRLAQGLGLEAAAGPFGVSSREQVLRRIAQRSQDGPLGPVVLVGHGTTSTFFPAFSVAPEALAAALAPHLGQAAVIGLAGCRAGADPGEVDWSPASYASGGSRSYAARLRDALVAAGAPVGCTVRAHSTTGSTTANPVIRSFPCTRSMVGQSGISVLEAMFGEGAASNAQLRTLWTQQARGKVAELWIVGAPLPSRLT